MWTVVMPLDAVLRNLGFILKASVEGGKLNSMNIFVFQITLKSRLVRGKAGGSRKIKIEGHCLGKRREAN